MLSTCNCRNVWLRWWRRNSKNRKKGLIKIIILKILRRSTINCWKFNKIKKLKINFYWIPMLKHSTNPPVIKLFNLLSPTIQKISMKIKCRWTGTIWLPLKWIILKGMDWMLNLMSMISNKKIYKVRCRSILHYAKGRRG